MRFLKTVAAVTGLFALQYPANAQTTLPLDSLDAIATGSTCQKGSGAPAAYIRGLARVYAKAVCQPDRSDVKVVAAARGAPGTDAGKSDALTVFDSEFTKLGMPNDKDGIDTLRHSYVLLLGLGLIESSGRYCVGRYTVQDFDKSYNAEAGPFQTSWGARIYSREVQEKLFERYRVPADKNPNPGKCMLGVFSDKITCKLKEAKNAGDPSEIGFQWQRITKLCPAFATEYAAVVLRTHGGSTVRTNEFGPINCYDGHNPNPHCQKPVLYPACDAMFSQVQALVQKDRSICASFE